MLEHRYFLLTRISTYLLHYIQLFVFFRPFPVFCYVYVHLFTNMPPKIIIFRNCFCLFVQKIIYNLFISNSKLHWPLWPCMMDMLPILISFFGKHNQAMLLCCVLLLWNTFITWSRSNQSKSSTITLDLCPDFRTVIFLYYSFCPYLTCGFPKTYSLPWYYVMTIPIEFP